MISDLKSLNGIQAACFVWFFVFAASGLFAGKNADDYYQLGRQEEADSCYIKAVKDYKKAAASYFKSGGYSDELIKAKNDVYRMECLNYGYAYTLSKLKQVIKKTYPWASKERIEEWSKRADLMRITNQGVIRYYREEADNLKFRDSEIMAGYIEYEHNPFLSFFESFTKEYVNDASHFDNFYGKPLDIMVDFQLSLKKSQLPKTGRVKIWWSLPLNTACQTDIVRITLEPARYVVSENYDGDIAYAYFEIPVEEVKGEVTIRSQIRYKHYQQKFELDSSRVEAYDKDSQLYKNFTQSSANIVVDDDITDQAKKIVGAETNPLNQAKLIYNYIVETIKYSFTPHSSLLAMKEPESQFVHERQYGDCGAQSMYFVALCRSLGIPSRCCGGYQALSGNLGTHFWAEFLIIYDGGKTLWIPSDVTAADLGDQVEAPAEEIKGFKDYFFGQQDPKRMIIQNDVDIMPTPVPAEKTYLSIVLQNPIIILESDKLLLSANIYFNCDMEFNYENALRSAKGAEFTVDAADFGVVTLAKSDKLFLNTTYFDKRVLIPAELVAVTESGAKATYVVPTKAEKIAYKLMLRQGQTESVSVKRLIVE